MKLHDLLPQLPWLAVLTPLLYAAKLMLKPPLEEVGTWLRRHLRSWLVAPHAGRGQRASACSRPNVYGKMWLTSIFADIDALEDAAVEDVALTVLGQAKSEERNFSPGNIIGSVTDGARWNSQRDRDRLRVILSEAFAWLEAEGLIVRDYSEPNGLWYFVSRRGRAIEGRKDLSSYAKGSYLPREVLREDIAAVAKAPFLAGRYDEAVRDAFTRIEVAVRDAAGYGSGQYGTAMMRDAFNPGKKDGSGSLGPLADPDLEFTEREAVAHLFAGAIGYIKNPLSHRELNIDDARIAASRILVANDLMFTLNACVDNKSRHTTQG